MTGTPSSIEGYREPMGLAPEQLAAIAAEAATRTEPVHILHLLRFHPKAQYLPGEAPASKVPLTGHEAYLTYASFMTALMVEVGATPVMSSSSNRVVDGPTGEKWDMMIIVRFPSRAAFLKMVESPAYRAFAHHRTAALADSRMMLTEPRT